MGDQVVLVLGFLPVVAFVFATFALANARPGWDWDRCFLRAAILLAAYGVLVSEALGLLHALSQAPLVGLWLVPVLVSSLSLARTARQGGIRLPRGLRPQSAPEWILLLIVAFVVVAASVVAFYAPPNTWDSLTYHMARVAHWAQAGSLNHYPTGIERQDLMSPGAEIGMLHLYLLAQGDHLVNLAQWSAMIGCLVGAGAIARLLGASRIGQLAAAAFVATLPMGIAQSTSTMTDYVVAFWAVCVSFETVSFVRSSRADAADIVPLGLAAGLAVLSKPTALAYLAPFAIVVAIVVVRRRGLLALLGVAAIAASLVLLITAGYFGRNLATYGHPFANARTVGTHSNEIFNGKVFISNLMRNASLHAGTPWPVVNDFVYRGLIWTHLKLGMSLTDPRTSVHPNFGVRAPEPFEASSGNPLHAAIGVVLVIVLGIAAARRDRQSALALGYLGVAVACFILLSSMFKFTVFGSRYHLPFFVLLAPVFGYAVGRVRTPWVAVALAGLMLFASREWILHLRERPLLPDDMGRSVLTTPRQSLYFMLAPGLEEPYRAVSDRLEQAACSSIGIMFSGDAAEYPLWVILGEPRSGKRLDWIVAGTPSARYTDPSFEPCAVICDGSCPEGWTSVRDLPLSFQVGPLRLYSSP